MVPADRQYYFGSPEKRMRFHEWGPVDKPVILLVHGFPGSGDHAKLISQTPHWNSFRLISMDRPGYGDSDLQKKITPLIFAEQIKEFLMAQQIEKFSLISVSGGAPFALAIAYVMGDAVQRVSCIGSVGPITQSSFFFLSAQQQKFWVIQKLAPRPLLHLLFHRIWKENISKLDEVLFTQEDQFNPQDYKVLTDPILGPELMNMTKTSLQKGAGGVVEDIYVFGSDWGFNISEIKCPVTLWHGSRDNIVHKRFSKFMKNRIPRARLRFIPNESHYSLLLNYRDQILEELLETPPSSSAAPTPSLPLH
ncbi:MAG: alpha/beta hydrolase [Bdellovibrionales bacterium]|nr:alpha/beta hydrolase [Bdellovibrionales bacterium]